MRARVQILDRGILVSDHELKLDSEYLFAIEGGIVDAETGYRLLGYELTGKWSTLRESPQVPTRAKLLAKIDELVALLHAAKPS